ncbi:MAG: M48 family metallopeptidase, partial [Bacteroidota bacterium]
RPHLVAERSGIPRALQGPPLPLALPLRSPPADRAEFAANRLRVEVGDVFLVAVIEPGGNAAAAVPIARSISVACRLTLSYNLGGCERSGRIPMRGIILFVFWVLAFASSNSALGQTVIHFPPPGPLTAELQTPTMSLSYPSDWALVEQEARQPGALILGLAAPDGIRQTEHGPYILCGSWISFLPLEGNAANQSLETLNEQVINSLMTAQVSFGPTQMVEGSRKRILVGAQNGIIQSLVTAFENIPERVWVAVVRSETGVWVFSFAAPEFDKETFEPTFSAMLDSVQFARAEPEPVSAAKSRCQQVIEHIVRRFQESRYKVPEFRILVTNKEEMNAYAYSGYNVVEIPKRWCEFFAGDEGELAFTIGHELGHLVDKDYAARRRHQTRQESLLGRVPRHVERELEARADEIGLKYLIGAGYNPYDAAAHFGRLLMFHGQTGILDQLLGRIFSTHPVDNDRIANFRKILVRYCEENPHACR